MTISRWPCAVAKCNGVSSPMFVAFTLTPRWMSRVTKFRWPSLAAQCKGLKPWSSLVKGSCFMIYSCFIQSDSYKSYPWFISCSVSSNQTRTCIAFPSLHQWKMSSIFDENKKILWYTKILWCHQQKYFIFVRTIDFYFTLTSYYPAGVTCWAIALHPNKFKKDKIE